MKVVFACKHWGSITLLHSGEKCCYHRNVFILLHTCDFWKTCREACHVWEVGKCQELRMCCCLWDGALGSLPMWVAGSRRDWTLMHPELPPSHECQEEASPEPTCTGSAPSQHILGLGDTQASRYLAVTCTLFSSSLLFSF